MIRSIIIDDEARNRKVLRTLLEQFCPKVSVEHEAGSARDALALIRETKPDLIFLDIEMPHGNGFELLDQLMPVDFEIIFITAFDEYTLRAFKYSALDYLLKPVNIDELKAAVERAENRINSKNINLQLKNLLETVTQKQNITRLAVPANDSYDFIQLDDIIRFEANANYTFIFTTKGQKYISSRNIKQYEEMLPENRFFRIHNAHIVNLDHVVRYRRGRGGEVEMSDKTILEVAARRKDGFLELIGYL